MARKSTPSNKTSREPSEEPTVPEKFKMTIGRAKKPEKPEDTNQNLKAGLTTQEAAAIVRAATRGVSPSFRPTPPKADLGQGESSSGQSKPSVVDEDWIAKTIAKTAALVSSGAAAISKEEKIKAERLKRAKMFASMIKSSSAAGGGPPLPQLLDKVESTVFEDEGSGCNNEVLDGGDNSKLEKRELGGSEREKKHHEKNYRKRDDSSERERSESKREKLSVEESYEENRKKRHKHRHHGEHHRRHHSSSDEERERTERRRERHSHKDRGYHSSSDEGKERTERKRERRSHRDREGCNRKRDRSHHRKDYSSSDSEEEDRHHRRSHRDERRRSPRKRSRDKKERSSSNVVESREDSSDIPDELRAKIRAMLRETF